MTKNNLLAALVCLAGCGAMYPGDELEGRWTADVRSQMTEDLAVNFASYTVALSFNRDGTYAFEARAVSTTDSVFTPGCTLTRLSRGTWSARTSGALSVVTATATAGTIERVGCRDASDNVVQRAAVEGELLELRSALRRQRKFAGAGALTRALGLAAAALMG